MRDIVAANNQLSIALLLYFNPKGAHELGLIEEESKEISNNLLTYITQVIVGKREKLHVFGRGYLTPDGTGNRISVLEIIQSLEKAYDKIIPYEIVSPRSCDVAMNFANTCKAKL